jgi:hypothetical protein
LNTLQAISSLAGEVDVSIRSVGTTNTWRRQSSTTWTTRRQPLLPVDRVAARPAETALLISGTRSAQVAV